MSAAQLTRQRPEVADFCARLAPGRAEGAFHPFLAPGPRALLIVPGSHSPVRSCPFRELVTTAQEVSWRTQAEWERVNEPPAGHNEASGDNLCLGTGPLGGIPQVYGYEVDETQALETWRRTFNSAITFVDTANAYGDAERRIGVVLEELGGVPRVSCWRPRSTLTPAATSRGSGWQVSRGERERLHMEYLPLVYLHDPENITFEEAMSPAAARALLKLRDEGAMGHLGLADGPTGLMRRLAETKNFQVLITNNRYTLLDRQPTASLRCAWIWMSPWSTRHRTAVGCSPVGRRPNRGTWYRPAREVVCQKGAEISHLCAVSGMPLAAAALQNSMRDHRITSTIVGVTRPERVAQTFELAKWEIHFGAGSS